ncbi:MAG: S8 family serine peptidase [Bacteroidota bacterium]
MNKVIPIFFLFWCTLGTLTAQQNSDTPDFDKSYFIVKFKPDSKGFFNKSDSKTLFPGFSVASVEPLHKTSALARKGKPSILDGIYKIRLSKESKDLLSKIEALAKRDDIVYAEPVYYDQPLVIPNDPLANPNSGSQYHLSLIQAYDGWDISTSDQFIRIAILDTGIEPDHIDLGTIAFNESDPINGIDDDGNGLIDDYMGWDFADSDNDPTSDQSDHGLKVAGISSAKTGNAIGIAGVGYNASFVPIKIFSSENGVSSNAYDAIMYAADEGYEILNLSWGSPNSFSQYRQDIINYAVDKGVVIVAAAGNTPSDLDFYPASYDHVLSVAATNENDQKADFSTFSRKVDLSAPGASIVTTETNNGFSQGSGTSFSSPQVAGAAALLMSINPDWTNLQIMEHLRVTTDNIDNVSGNQEFENFLGSGRLNVFTALSKTNTKSARIEEFSFSNGIGEFAYYDDTVRVKLQIQNFLSPVEALRLEISSENTGVNLLTPTIDLGRLDSMENVETEFLVYLNEFVGPDELLQFQIDYTGTDYNDIQFIEFQSSSDRIDFGIGRSFITSNSKAELGHESNVIGDGVGFQWDERRLLENMGLMIGLSEDSLVDNAMTNVELLFRNNDLSSQQNLKYYNHPEADIYAAGILNTIDEVNLALKVEHNYYAWNTDGEDSNIILEYRLTNTSEDDYDSLRIGLLANWDINTAVRNTAVWHEMDSIAVVYDEDNPVFSGMAILNEDLSWNYNTIDISEKSVTENTNVSKQDKYEQLSVLNTDTLKNTDVVQTLSVLLPEIPAHQSVKVAFVLTGALGYEEVMDHVALAKERYQKILVNPRTTDFTTTCQGGDAVLTPSIGGNIGFYRDSQAANLIATGESLGLENLEKDTIVYYRSEPEDSGSSDVFAYQINVIPTIAQFELSTDTLFLDDINRVYFTNTSAFTQTTSWDFGNGLLTDIENPSTVYETEGIYNVTLNIESVFGCSDAVTRQLVVLNKNPQPVLNALDTVCFGNSVEILAENSDSVNVYSDSSLSELLFSGSAFESAAITENQTFYVTNVRGPYESNPTLFEVVVESVVPEIVALPDTLALSESAMIVSLAADQSLTVTDWSINGVDAGDGVESRFSLEGFEGDEAIAQVTAVNMRGCVGESQRSIAVRTSDAPFFSNQTVCNDASLTIEPMNGEYFAFYAEENSSTALGKGGSFILQDITSDTSIYIRGIDEFLESNAVKVDILVEEFDASISSSLEKVTLDDSGLAVEVTFDAEGDGISSQKWFLDDTFVDIVPQIKLFFKEEGIFDIKLIAENNTGCISEDSIKLEVSKESIITTVRESNDFSVFPNPTTGIVNIPDYLDKVELYTLSGERILSRSAIGNVLDISELEAGVYILKSWMSNGGFINTAIILRK